MSFESKFHNKRVRWFTDNQNVVRVVLHGCKKPILQTEAIGLLPHFDSPIGPQEQRL